MKTYIMTEAEHSLADIIWDNEPVKSGELVSICSQRLNWKKSTTYTVLKKICENNIFKNEASIVSSSVTRDDYKRLIGESYLEENYNGSLPNFVAAFMRGGRLKKDDIDELTRLINDYKED